MKMISKTWKIILFGLLVLLLLWCGSTNAKAIDNNQKQQITLSSQSYCANIGELEEPLEKCLEQTPEEKWALLNFVYVVLTLVLAGMIIVTKKKEKAQVTNQKRNKITLGAMIIVSTVSFVVFILTENMMLTMQISDQWTLLMFALLIGQLHIFVNCKKWQKRNN